jgi:putative drug exporter of the RND superfamily
VGLVSSFLYRLGRLAARGRLFVVALWLVVLAVAGGAAVLLDQGTDDTFAIPGSQSQDALDQLGHVYPTASGTSAQFVVLVPAGRRVDTPVIRHAVAAVVTRIGKVDQVATVADPFDGSVSDAVSPDRRAALITVPLTVPQSGVEESTKTALAALGADLRQRIGGGAKVYVGGSAFSDLVPGLSVTEVIGLAIALLVLLLVFRSLIAALMPLVTAVLGVGISMALISAATRFTTISSTAQMLAVMLGLAVGIDYALFILSRHRDQLAEGLDVEESVARATATAGSAVIFAGMTVVIALLGLFVADIPFLSTMGVCAALGVAIAVLVAITLVPALLGVFGGRLRPSAPRRAKRRPGRGAADPDTGRLTWAARWIRWVTRVPAVTALIVVAVLAVCAIPAAGLRLALPDNGTNPVGSAARTTYDAVAEHFGPGYPGPLLVTADIIATTDPVGVTDKIAAELKRLPGVAAVPLATPEPKGEIGIIQVVPSTAPDSAATESLVHTIRSLRGHFQQEYGVGIAVTGLTAVGIDVSSQLGGALVPFGLLVAGLSLVLLAMVFRSVAVPVKATAGYLLSVGAAFGATSFVFVQGHLAGLFGVAKTGSVISFLPIILMGVLFGLAMDYEVFLVSRIREDFVHGGDPRQAIESGFVSASRVVTAAALIMFAVFISFVPEPSPTVKPIAFSLAVGVFVDAFIVRMTLVPAILALLGRRAWRLPTRVDRTLPVFDAEGASLMRELRLADWPAPDSPELISARELGVADDRGGMVFTGVDLHVGPGQLLAAHGTGPCGKSALLYALGGRIARLEGDLRVAGRVLPEHARAVRTRVALVACRDAADPADEVRRALDDGVTVILIDDIDVVVRVPARQALREMLSSLPATGTASVVITCQNLATITDLLPPDQLPPQHVIPLALPTHPHPGSASSAPPAPAEVV